MTVRRIPLIVALAALAGAAVCAGPASGARPALDDARLGPDGSARCASA